jgi:hypothetical protein
VASGSCRFAAGRLHFHLLPRIQSAVSDINYGRRYREGEEFDVMHDRGTAAWLAYSLLNDVLTMWEGGWERRTSRSYEMWLITSALILSPSLFVRRCVGQRTWRRYNTSTYKAASPAIDAHDMWDGGNVMCFLVAAFGDRGWTSERAGRGDSYGDVLVQIRSRAEE